MKRPYEVAFVLRMDPNDDVLREHIQDVKGWIEAEDQGTVNKIDEWGRRRLAYEIDKQREGYYVFIYADVEGGSLLELERNFQLAQHVLRYMVIRADD